MVATALRDWLPVCLPYTDPWVSSEDIDKGTRWSTEIAAQLNDVNFGIICVVPGNIFQPWLNFEAGATSKSLDAGRVAPLLVGVAHDDVAGPLSQFQLTVFERGDMLRLVRSINNASSEPIPDERAEKNFSLCWRTLEEAIAQIEFAPIAKTDEALQSDLNDLDDAQTEILVLLARYDGQDFSADQLAQQLSQNITRTKLYLNQLEENEYVYESLNMITGASYSISDRGREYVITRDLI